MMLFNSLTDQVSFSNGEIYNINQQLDNELNTNLSIRFAVELAYLIKDIADREKVVCLFDFILGRLQREYQKRLFVFTVLGKNKLMFNREEMEKVKNWHAFSVANSSRILNVSEGGQANRKKLEGIVEVILKDY